MTKILFVANVAKEHILKFHVPTIKMLTEMGWQVDVACGGNESIPYCHKQYKLSYQRTTFNIKTLQGIREVKEIVNQEDYDIIYCHTLVGGVAGRIAGIGARKKGTKVIYFSHGHIFCKDTSFINWLLFYPLEKILAKVTDAIICINQEDYILTRNKLKPRKTYLVDGIGVDYERFDLEHAKTMRSKYREDMAIDENATVLIYLAELTANKNQKLLLDMLKILLGKDKNIYLVLAGADHYKGKIEKYAKKIGVDSNVRILGWRDDVANLYAMSDICVASSKREGLGLNLVEAMYCGLPIVASKNRGHATIIEDGKNGYLIENENTQAFADKVMVLIQDLKIRNKFIQAGYITQQKYGRERVLKEIKEILEDSIYT